MESGFKTRKILVINPEYCTGCRTCEMLCSLRAEKEINPEQSRVRVVKWEERGIYIPAVCLQCETPVCRDVCPVKALYESPETGAIVVNYDICIGCKLCVYACPFGGVSTYGGKITKCDLCGGDPICVKVCPKRVLEYVDEDKMGIARKRAGMQKLLGLMGLVMGVTGETLVRKKEEVI